MKDRVIGCLIGLACGDAVGTTLEFTKRGQFEPITDMVGGGPFGLRKGQWTDDTSMALCLGHSLVACQSFDAADQMQRYLNWYRAGYMSSTGQCFDIGNTVRAALERYIETDEPLAGSTDSHSSGNGSLMRLAPIPMFYHADQTAAVDYAGESSRTTHGSEECIACCRLFSAMILTAFHTTEKVAILQHGEQLTTPKVAEIARGEFLKLSYADLQGSGYAVESLISALWCFFNTDDFRSAILKASNLGNDADTTAAICGQIAGAFYGFAAIPVDWRESITMANEIVGLGERLFEIGVRH